jgi:hypothetical protein
MLELQFNDKINIIVSIDKSQAQINEASDARFVEFYLDMVMKDNE